MNAFVQLGGLRCVFVCVFAHIAVYIVHAKSTRFHENVISHKSSTDNGNSNVLMRTLCMLHTIINCYTVHSQRFARACVRTSRRH